MRDNLFSVSRRQFGQAIAGASAALGANAVMAKPAGGGPWSQPARVAKVYMYSPAGMWPRPGLDFEQEMREIDVRLAEVEQKHLGRVKFVGVKPVRPGDDVGRWAADLNDIDGLLLVTLSTGIPIAEVLEATKRPSIYFSLPYAGHGWASIAGLRQRGYGVEALPTTSYGDLDPYMPVFQAASHLRRSKMIVVTGRAAQRRALTDSYTAKFGAAIKFMSLADMKDVFASGDPGQAGKLAEEMTAGALRVIEPSPREIQDAMRFYLGIKKLLAEEQANAITIDCFGAISRETQKMDQLPAYPCMSWSLLNDEGMYGVCESDVNSTMTQMLLTPATGMPGFVSDPVFDLSRNEVIHAHCVSARKMRGLNGPSAPYLLRSHLETAEGATFQVLLPAGDTITCARFNGPDRLLVTTAEVTGHIQSDRGCRTQFRTVVSDARKWLDNYSGGLHRVIFYGNHTGTLKRMGRMMGFEVVDEMA